MNTFIDEIFDLFARFGADGYGEDLSLERHMLQSAVMADSRGHAKSVVAAALLHDIGYFLQADAAKVVTLGRDFGHEALGAAWLSRGFDEDVTAPIALHVQAKRYLCAVEAGYFEQLSDASRTSLALQGGIMSESEVTAFAKQPGFSAALILRRCDDRGKDVDLPAQNIESFRGLLMTCLTSCS